MRTKLRAKIEARLSATKARRESWAPQRIGARRRSRWLRAWLAVYCTAAAGTEKERVSARRFANCQLCETSAGTGDCAICQQRRRHRENMQQRRLAKAMLTDGTWEEYLACSQHSAVAEREPTSRPLPLTADARAVYLSDLTRVNLSSRKRS